MDHTYSRTAHPASKVGGSHAYDRSRLSEEFLETWPDGEAIELFPAGRRPLRVLIADHKEDAAESLSFLVKMWGHDVRRAYDGAEAFEMTLAYQPDVLLLNTALPKINGCRLAQRLRGQPRFTDTLLIAVTEHANETYRLLCEESGFDLYLNKPVEPSTLETLMLLEQYRLAQSLEAPFKTRRNYGILVVDDEGGVRGLLKIGLRQQGFTVWLAADGQEALDLYRQHGAAIDVVLLDVRMPGQDGPETLAALQELNPRIRCCFMSGDLGKHATASLLKLGAAAVLPKPFRLAEIAQVLWELARAPA